MNYLIKFAPCDNTVYDANGQYKGYSQTNPSGVTSICNSQGQNVQSFHTDN